ncbi:hypothetical protein F5884DRAFT_850267 [Xylogone sp. PMI_703]|nr:hypothetical protein F5884DRAFT_850267 [Xylogone sp. PMI_703]
MLPLGDSITHGYQGGVGDGNGYRLPLWDRLTANPKDFVGSTTSGNMSHPRNEGHDGAIITQIQSFAKLSLGTRPNVILIHAGTNDMGKNVDPDNAPARLGALIDEVVDACPDAAVIVAKIIPPRNRESHERTVKYWAAIPGVIAERANAGKHVMMVDMTSLPTSHLIDGLHPTDQGYDEMGAMWYAAIQEAGAKGWIKKPVQPSTDAGLKEGAEVCNSPPIWIPQGEIASGIGESLPFKSIWYPNGEIAGGLGKASGVRFGDLDGDGRDDYLWVHSDGSVTAYLNTVGRTRDDVVWIPRGIIASGIGKDDKGVRFADIDGDGRDDYLWVSPTGEVTCYLNLAGESRGRPSWKPIGEIASGVGARDRVLFGDVNGDGRDDYLLVTDSGGLQAWLNTGSGDAPVWKPQGDIAGGIGAPEGVRIADLNNDGRDDYLWVDKDGAVTMYANLPGIDDGHPSWWPQGEIASGVGFPRSAVTFADINGDGKSDYLGIKNKTGAVHQWQNGGYGGVSQIGPGIVFADLNGDGKDDYLSVDKDGKVTAYVNGGTYNGKQMWLPQGEIAGGVGAKRSQIRFGDMDGDGKVEYLVVHDNGAVDSYRNVGSSSPALPGKVTWVPQGSIAGGVGNDGEGVVFADLNGDGRDDYLWVSPGGQVLAFLNGGGDPGHPNWIPQGIIASGVGATRDEVRFADLNGDGRVEYLQVSARDGAIKAWYNGGSLEGNNGPNAGKIIWYPLGEIAGGVGTSGSHIRFGDLSGNGRAHYISIVNGNGAASVWNNGCNDVNDPSDPVTGAGRIPTGFITPPGFDDDCEL